jgi:hypothetical protein
MGYYYLVSACGLTLSRNDGTSIATRSPLSNSVSTQRAHLALTGVLLHALLRLRISHEVSSFVSAGCFKGGCNGDWAFGSSAVL